MTVSLVLYQGMKLGLSLFLVLGTLRSGVDSSLTRENTKKKVQMNKTEKRERTKGTKIEEARSAFLLKKRVGRLGIFSKASTFIFMSTFLYFTFISC